jgi:ubiquinone/menaquinone biosynthesis C-methylase UbiE
LVSFQGFSFQPFEVFAEVHRILKPSGRFLVTFSSHILDEKKAIKAWVFSNDAYHLFIVTFYFQISAQWEQVTIKELKSKTRRNSDILYAVQGIKKSTE